MLPLLRPPIDLSAPHPLALVLADVHRLLSLQGLEGELKKSAKVARKKLEFLAACVGVVGRTAWEGIKNLVEKELEKQAAEEEDGSDEEAGDDDDAGMEEFGIGRKTRQGLTVGRDEDEVGSARGAVTYPSQPRTSLRGAKIEVLEAVSTVGDGSDGLAEHVPVSSMNSPRIVEILNEDEPM